VIADAVGRQACDGVVDDVHLLRHPATIVIERCRRHHAVIGDGIARVVELHQEAGIDDHLVFGVHRRRDGRHNGVFAFIEFILAVRDDACRRRHRQERFFHLYALECSLEVVDVALQLRLPGVLDRPDANCLGRGGDAFARIELGIEFRETLAVGAALERIGGIMLDRTALEAAQTLQCILRPADRFAELAVAHHVDTGLRLLTHDGGDALGQAFLVRPRVVRLAGLLGAQKLLQSWRADQAADMAGENAVAAALHA
jgi:hypothetical protein